MKIGELLETATAGATSSGSIATVSNPHLSPGKARGKKSYTGSPWTGSGTKSPPQPKPKKQKPTDNALDKNTSLFGEGNLLRRQNVKEAFDNAEYNDEAGMAESNLHTLGRAVEGLLKSIKEDDNLPEWCQEKIAKAEMMLVSVWDYLLSQKEQGIDPKI
jgi:hypothetical protein